MLLILCYSLLWICSRVCAWPLLLIFIFSDSENKYKETLKNLEAMVSKKLLLYYFNITFCVKHKWLLPPFFPVPTSWQSFVGKICFYPHPCHITVLPAFCSFIESVTWVDCFVGSNIAPGACWQWRSRRRTCSCWMGYFNLLCSSFCSDGGVF